jgi:hypothetical protein
MVSKISAIAAVWLFIAPAFVYAQTTHTLKGKIMTSDGRPLEGAAVYLRRAADSVLVKSAVSDSAGAYVFFNLRNGSYRLVVNRVGYGEYKSGVIELAMDSVLAVIAVSGSADLRAVTVAASRPLVEHLLDRTVVNPEALISGAGTTVLELMEKLPGVMVDPNGIISLQGKAGVTVYVDDRPTYLSGENLANYLRSLSSSTIDRIELMPNPPARYDAAGNAGVINIRLKRIREKGFNGNLNIGLLQGRYGRTNDNLALNYRQNKLNLSVNLGYLLNNGYNSIVLNRRFDQSVTGLSPNFTQNAYVRRPSESYTVRCAVDYYATGKSTFGIIVSGLLAPSHNYTSSTSLLTNAQKRLDSSIVADNREDRELRNGSVNLNYRHAYDKKGTEHAIDVDLITYRNRQDQRFVNTGYYPDGTLYDSSLETGSLPAVINIFSASTDYSRPISDGVMLSGGVKTSYTHTDNIANYFNVPGTVAEPDYDKTNHFVYKENINAVYANFKKDLKRLSVQAGLRFENTNASGHQLGNAVKPDSSFSRSYNGLFPTLYVQYNLDSGGKQQVHFNYGRRLDRPYYAALNPFLSPLDKFTYNAGNPFLLPTYSDNFELSYGWKGISATVYFTYIKDKSDGLVQIINGYYYNRPGNLDHTYVKGIEVDGGFDAAKWFNLHLYARWMTQRTKSAFYTGPLDTKGDGYFIRPVLTFRPDKDWTVQLDGSYRSRLPTEQFVDADRKVVNLAVSKKLSGSSSLRVVVNDVFHSLENRWTIGYLAGTQADFRSVADSRNVAVTFSYRWGKAIQGQRKHEANGAQSEKERAGN